MENETYIPGTCNISGFSLRKRKRFALMVSFLTVCVLLLLELIPSDKRWKFLVFPPVTLTLIAWFQVFYKFCVLYGLTGLFSTKEEKIISVENKSALHLDKIKAFKLIIASILLGFALTVLFFYI